MELTILTPNGLLLNLNVNKNLNLKKIKEEVFELAQNEPLFGNLYDPSSYLFSCVNFKTSMQKFYDDESYLYEIKPFHNILRLIRKKDDKEEQQLNAQIGILINKGLHEFEALKNPEINSYRWLVQKFTDNIKEIRKNFTILDYLKHNYPIRIEKQAKIPDYLGIFKLNKKFYIKFRLNNYKTFFSIKINFFDKIVDIKLKCLKLIEKKIRGISKENFKEKENSKEKENFKKIETSLENFKKLENSIENFKKLENSIENFKENDFLMKVNGKEEYLLENYPIIQYTYILESLSNSTTPSFVIKNLNDFNISYQETKSSKCLIKENFLKKRSMSYFLDDKQNNKLNFLSIFNVSNNYKLKICLNNINKINCSDDTLIFILISLYQGNKLLCKEKLSKVYNVKNGIISLDELLEFDINLNNLSRTCRISLIIFELIPQTYKKFNNSLVCYNTKNDILFENEDLFFSNLKSSSNYRSTLKRKKNIKDLYQNLEKISLNNNFLISPISWTNLSLFDYKDIFKAGPITKPMWNFIDFETNDWQIANVTSLNDLIAKINHFKYDENKIEGDFYWSLMNSFNCNLKFNNSSFITLTILNENSKDLIFYPKLEQIIDFYNKKLFNNEDLLQSSIIKQKTITKNDKSKGDKLKKKNGYQLFENSEDEDDKISLFIKSNKINKPHLEQIKDICKKDPLFSLNDKDKELLWHYKDFCKKNIPCSLTHVIASVKWNDKNQVIELLLLINEWPLLNIEKGLELLDIAYSDLFVRNFAVKCLRQMSDEELNLYLLQLVQALKFESYIQNDLNDFLLERAIQNPNIGHCLFWLLRSEMHDPTLSVKFGLLLEAYCRGAANHMKVLFKQLETLNKFKEINEIIRQEAFKKKENRDKLKETLKNILKQACYQNSFNDIVNPLNPREKLNQIKINKCNFMDSKMKPLWLVFSNEDFGTEDISIIFKNGDDLRKDMLTLQMLRIMDKIWKNEGLDLRLSLYNVIATDYKVGLIEVVPNAYTIANIQKEKAFSTATSAFQKSSLLQWLKEKNPSLEQQNKAIDEFTKSCAGYCVATYVLGIADRHSDNIMLKSNGQLLHIDFGHILGNFKEKWKIRRERVPFVFTNDFEFVITNGSSKKIENERFENFLNICDQAFLKLRSKGTFIISLFAMMLSTGFKVSSLKDLNYLKETLVLDLNEKEALKHFKNKFNESMRNGWKTSFNWFAHNISKDNK